MFRPLSLFIALRYTRAKRRNHFISFISLASMLGIALGVMVLITVLSVMNGFDYQIRTRFFSVAPEVTVVTDLNITKTWPQLQKKITALPTVKSAVPYISGKGMLLRNGQFNGIQVLGIIPKEQEAHTTLGKYIVDGKLSSLTPGAYNMVIGEGLAESLGLGIGDKVTLLTPQTTTSLAGTFPRYRQFTISGIFHVSKGFGFDNTVAYINFGDAAKLFPSPYGNSGLHIKLYNLYLATPVSQQIQSLLSDEYAVTNWTNQFGAFFNALAMEKTMLFVILLLIIAVAVFNLVSTLVMVVNEKRADIAIMRTLGASPRMIMSTFILQGALVGLIGTLLGLGLGLLLASNVTAIVNWIQHIFHVQFLSSSVYFIDYLPSKIEPWDILKVCSIAFGLSLVATLYPASIAFRTQPAEALRYE